MNNCDWYSPGQITFTKHQVIWLLRHLPEIRVGFWPSEHKETGYSGKAKGKVGHAAYFEKPVQVAAELDQRLEMAGIDGLLLEFVYSSESQDIITLEQHIANAMRLEFGTVERRIETALRYVCGKARKSRDYQDFKRHRKSK